MYTNRMRMTGLSGLDTEAMVRQLMTAESVRFNRLKQQSQILTWTQEAYRGVASSLKTYQDSFLNLANLSASFRSSSNFINMTPTIKSNGVESSAISAKVSANTPPGDYLLEVDQIAQKDTYQSSTAVGSKFVASTAFNEKDLNLGDRFTFTLDSSTTRTISFSYNELVDIEKGTTDLQTVLNDKLKTAFGTETVKNPNGTGMITQQKVSASKTSDGRLVISASSGHTATLESGNSNSKLGFVTGEKLTTETSTSTSIADMFEHNSSVLDGGDRVSFDINGVTFNFDKSDSIDKVLDQVNNSSAGVNLSYNKLSGKFTMEAKESGTASTITFNDRVGNFINSGLGFDSIHTYEIDVNGKKTTLEFTNTELKKINSIANDKDRDKAFQDAINAKLKDAYGVRHEVKSAVNLGFAGYDYDTNKFVTNFTDHNGNPVTANLTFNDPADQNYVTLKVNLNGEEKTFTKSYQEFEDVFYQVQPTDMDKIYERLFTADVISEFGLVREEIPLVQAKVENGEIKSISVEEITKTTETEVVGPNGTEVVVQHEWETKEYPNTGANGDSLNGTIATLNEIFKTDTSENSSNILKAQDAVFTFNGVSTTRSTNEFELEGIEFALTRFAAGQTFEISVAKDTSKTLDFVKSFVEEYNNLVDILNTPISTSRPKSDSYSFYEPLTDDQKKEMSESEIEKWEEKAKTGMLHNDSTLRAIAQEMRSMIYRTVTTSSGENIALHNIGITTSNNLSDKGKLVIDEERLAQALEDRGDDIAELFTKSSSIPASDRANRGRRMNEQGLSERLNDIINNAIGIDGSITLKAGIEGDTVTEQSSTLYNRLKNLNDQINLMNTYLVNKENHYFTMFSKLEAAMVNADNQMASLQSFMGGA